MRVCDEVSARLGVLFAATFTSLTRVTQTTYAGVCFLYCLFSFIFIADVNNISRIQHYATHCGAYINMVISLLLSHTSYMLIPGRSRHTHTHSQVLYNLCVCVSVCAGWRRCAWLNTVSIKRCARVFPCALTYTYTYTHVCVCVRVRAAAAAHTKREREFLHATAFLWATPPTPPSQPPPLPCERVLVHSVAGRQCVLCFFRCRLSTLQEQSPEPTISHMRAGRQNAIVLPHECPTHKHTHLFIFMRRDRCSAAAATCSSFTTHTR